MVHCEPHALRILIADRAGPARSALASMLSAIDDVVVVGAEGSAYGLRVALHARRPDVVVIDDRLLGEWREPDDLAARLLVVGGDDERGGDRIVAAVDDIRRSLIRRTPPPPLALHGAPESSP